MKFNIKKYLGEGFLIVFSVLFALLINKIFEDYQTNQRKSIAQESIIKELEQNEAILKYWQQSHIEMRNRITDIIEGRNDSLKQQLKKYEFLKIGVLTGNKSLIEEILTNTAWESAKTTGIIAEFDYETIQKLTHVYLMQEALTEVTIRKILDYYFDTESHNIENIDKILVQFQLRFWELTGQEALMTGLYRMALDQIKNNN